MLTKQAYYRGDIRGKAAWSSVCLQKRYRFILLSSLVELLRNLTLLKLALVYDNNRPMVLLD